MIIYSGINLDLEGLKILQNDLHYVRRYSNSPYIYLYIDYIHKILANPFSIKEIINQLANEILLLDINRLLSQEFMLMTKVIDNLYQQKKYFYCARIMLCYIYFVYD